MSDQPANLKKQMDQDAWASQWWNVSKVKRAVPFGLVGGFVVWLIFALQFHKVLMTKETWDAIFPFDLVVFLVGGPIVYYATSYFRAKRRLGLEQWCQSHGWEFSASSRTAKLGFREGRAPGILLGRSAHGTNVMWKKVDDRTVAVGHVNLWNGKTDRGSHKVVACTYLTMEIDNPAPEVIIHHHSTHFSRTVGEPELSKVKFESEEFNRHWTVLSVDPKGAYDLMDQSTIECLMGVGEKMYIEFKGGVLTLFLVGESDLDQRVALAKIAERFSRAVPDDLLKPISILAN